MDKNEKTMCSNAPHTRIYEEPNEESISFIDDKTARKSLETFSKEHIENNCSSTMEKQPKEQPNYWNQYLATLVGKYRYEMRALINMIS